MPTAESVKAKLQGLIDQANATTGSGDADLTTAVGSLIAGFGGGGGEAFQQKFYETDFVMDESITSNGTICTISTGLSDDLVTVDNELVTCIVTCEPTVSPASNWVKKMIQFISPNQGTIQSPQFGFYVQSNAAMTDELRKSFTSGVGCYIGAVATDLSSLSIHARFNLVPPAVGNYHLQLYRTGVSV